jgi:hypothetical protein
MAIINNPALPANNLLTGIGRIEKKFIPAKQVNQGFEEPSKFTDRAKPVRIVFLSGQNKGKTLYVGQWLGMAIEKSTVTSGVEWTPVGAKGIRNALTFSKFLERRFTISLSFYSHIDDISSLTENLQHLTAAGGGEIRPPFLSFIQGDMIASPVVCDGAISVEFSNPRNGRTAIDEGEYQFTSSGYMKGDVELTFVLQGGLGSPHAFSKPLAPTPLGTELEQESANEREKKGQAKVVAESLAPCLGAAGSKEIEGLVLEDKLTNDSELLKLSEISFAQLAIAGLIPKEKMQSGAIRSKLEKSVSKLLANKHPGANTEADKKQFASYLRDEGDPPTPLVGQSAVDAKNDYVAILAAIANQELNDKSDIFAPASQRAGNKLRGVGDCGLSLRKAGANSVLGDNIDRDNATLQKMKEFLEKSKKGEVSDDEIKKAFATKEEKVVKAIKNAAPFTTKTAFIDKLSRTTTQMKALALWSSFTAYEPESSP